MGTIQIGIVVYGLVIHCIDRGKRRFRGQKGLERQLNSESHPKKAWSVFGRQSASGYVCDNIAHGIDPGVVFGQSVLADVDVLRTKRRTVWCVLRNEIQRARKPFRIWVRSQDDPCCRLPLTRAGG
jgi:hypothetical protein